MASLDFVHLDDIWRWGQEAVSGGLRQVAFRTSELGHQTAHHQRWPRPGDRLPLPFHTSEQYYVAVVELARVLASEAVQRRKLLSPGTSWLLATSVILYMKPRGFSYHEVCLSPYLAVQRKQLWRFVSSSSIHIDASHLASAWGALLPACLYVEDTYGTDHLVHYVMVLLSSTHALHVAASKALNCLVERSHSYYNTSVPGLFPLALALQVVAGHDQNDYVRAFGIIPLPSEYSAWITLFGARYVVPCSAYFPAVCGLWAGVLFSFIVKPVFFCHGARHRRPSWEQQDSLAFKRSLRRQPRPLVQLAVHCLLSAAFVALNLVVGRRKRRITRQTAHAGLEKMLG